MPLFLTSLSFTRLSPWLDAHGAGPRVTVITTASRDLEDRDAIVAPAMAAIEGGGREAVAVDVLNDSRSGAERSSAWASFARHDRSHEVEAILMTGGDPFLLLAALKLTGADRQLRDVHRRGVLIAGQSAGAMVCGPTLEPARLTSPFAPAPGADLDALELTHRLVLPHHDQPGRARRHRQSALTFSRDTSLWALWDDEALLTGDDGAWRVEAGSVTTRPAKPSDADAVDAVYRAAAEAAWAPFLGADRLAANPPDPNRWRARMEASRGGFLVAEDDGGVAGFAQWQPAEDPDLEATVGEVSLLYTHPRSWGSGIGRRLLDRVTWQLLCAGFQQAVLWTEHRNERALAVYRANGWILDGQVRERDYLGVSIRELRHRLNLIHHGGGE